MALQVRRLGADDVDAYRNVRLAGLADSPFAFGSTFEEEAGQPRSFFEDRIAAPAPAAVFGAVLDGTLAGIARFTTEPGIRRRHIGWMTGVTVLPPFRRKGIGAALVTHVVRHARGACVILRAGVSVGNDDARALYAAAGFTVYGREPRALWVDGTYHDELLLNLDLDGLSGPKS